MPPNSTPHSYFVCLLAVATLHSAESHDRFDCHPEPNADESGCQQRGCVWNSTIETLGAPFCFYPDDYGYVIDQSMQQTSNGYYGMISQQDQYPSPYGNDISQVSVSVFEETSSRVRIIFDDANSPNQRYRVPIDLPPTPSSSASDPLYKMSFSESDGSIFGIQIYRATTGSLILDTALPGFTMSDQFLQISMGFPADTNLFGWGERFSGLKLPNNYTTVASFAHDVGDYLTYQNSYGVHPFALGLDPNTNEAFGVFIVNSNAMELVVTPNPAFQYRTIGGILDIYVFLGPSPNDVVMQYWDVIGTPFLPPYWTLGFHLCRWGYDSSNNTRAAVESMRAAEIPYDTQWNDIDYMDALRDFTYDPVNFAGLPDLVDDLHNKYSMRYVHILDPAIFSQSNDSYAPYTSGLAQDVFIRNLTGDVLYGTVWPGQTAFPDFFKNDTVSWWTSQINTWQGSVHFDGLWVDMNEPSNFVDGSIVGCPQNSTLDNPPYVPANLNTDTLYEKTVCMSSRQTYGFRNDKNVTDHYNVHSLFGYSEILATYAALQTIRPGQRSFILSRSTFAGAGQYAAHWNGDNNANYQDMAVSIKLLFAFNMFGITMVGSDICGFNGDTTVELCARWMQVGAFYPFSRNHNTVGDLAQDPVSLGEPVTSISRDVLNIRYTLLPNLYTLYWKANKGQSMVVYSLLFWWPQVDEVVAVEDQFLWGDFFMISPVLTQNTTSRDVTFPLLRNDTSAVNGVNGVFSERWFDYFSGEEVIFSNDSIAEGYETIEIDTDLDEINLHVRGGSVLTLHDPDGGLTTLEMSGNPYQILAALDSEGEATGEVYFDDGVTLDTKEFVYVVFGVSNASLSSRVASNNYTLANNGLLDEIVVWGIDEDVADVTLVSGAGSIVKFDSNMSVLTISCSLNITQEWTVAWSVDTKSAHSG